MPTTQYLVSTDQAAVISDKPCLLQGITIQESAGAGVDYFFCDITDPTPENVVMIIRSLPRSARKLSFPQPIYLSQGLYFESVGGTPTITFELL